MNTPSFSDKMTAFFMNHFGTMVIAMAICIMAGASMLVYKSTSFSSKAFQSWAAEENAKTLTMQTKTANTGDIKVSICHNNHTITIDQSAVDTHLRHGDMQGACNEETEVITTPESKIILCHKKETISVLKSAVEKYIEAGATQGACNEETEVITTPTVEVKQVSIYLPYNNPFKKIEDRCDAKLKYLDQQGIRKSNGNQLGSPDIISLKTLILTKPIQNGTAMTTQEVVKIIKIMNSSFGQADSTALCGQEIKVPVVKFINKKTSSKVSSQGAKLSPSQQNLIKALIQ